MKQSVNFLTLTLWMIYGPYLFGQTLKTDEGVDRNNQLSMVSERIRLSYFDPARCSQLLNFYGINI